MLRETKRGDTMYCPICATENPEEKTVKMVTSIELPPRTQFCRSCGSNLTLVPQALTGRLPEAPSSRRRHRNRHHEDQGPAHHRKWNKQSIHGSWFHTGFFGCLTFRTCRSLLVVLAAHPRVRDAWKRSRGNRKRKIRSEPEAGGDPIGSSAGSAGW